MEKKILLLGMGAIVAILLLSGCTSNSTTGGNSNSNSNAQPPQTDTEVRIPVSDIGTTVRFYSYDSDGITVRYFTVKDSQGTIHVAFDACDVCYEAKKGYNQVGDLMQCLNCGQQFAITRIGVENTAGGCWPSYLPMNIDGNNVVIQKADLEAKTYMF